MGAYNLTIDQAKRLSELYKKVNKKFLLENIKDVIVYENELKIKFSEKLIKRILKFMDKIDPKTSEYLSVTEARIQACIKTTQKEPAYRKYPKDKIELISRHFVQESPKLTFEEAREALGLLDPKSI